MPKPHSRRGGGRKSRHHDTASDVEMVDVVLPQAERYSRKRDKNSGPLKKHEDVRRSRVGRLLKDNSISQLASTNSRNDRAPHGTKTRSHVSSGQPLNGVSSSSRHSAVVLRSSADSPHSSRSSRAVVPWCERCIHLNRQLRDYLFELFDTGRRAIDEWTCATGVSLDHMDYERTRTVAAHESIEGSSQICQSCTTNARYGPERQDLVKAVSPPRSSLGSSGGTLSNNSPVDNHLRGLKPVDGRRLPGISFLENTPQPMGSKNCGLGSQRTDYGEPPTQAPLHARWADENVGPAQQPHNHLADQQQPQTPVNATSQLASPNFPPRESRSPEMTFQQFHTDQGDPPSRGVILPPIDLRWAPDVSGNETSSGSGRVPPSVNDIGVIYEAVDYHARGRAAETPRHWAQREEMVLSESP